MIGVTDIDDHCVLPMEPPSDQMSSTTPVNRMREADYVDSHNREGYGELTVTDGIHIMMEDHCGVTYTKHLCDG